MIVFYSWVEFVYRIGFHIISDVYVRFHRLVVAMSRPFHDHLCRNAERQGITDESPSSGLGAKQCVFGCNGINTPAPFRVSPKGQLYRYVSLCHLFSIRFAGLDYKKQLSLYLLLTAIINLS